MGTHSITAWSYSDSEGPRQYGPKTMSRQPADHPGAIEIGACRSSRHRYRVLLDVCGGRSPLHIINHRTYAMEASDRAPLARVFAMVGTCHRNRKRSPQRGPLFVTRNRSGAMGRSAGGGRRQPRESHSRSRRCPSRRTDRRYAARIRCGSAEIVGRAAGIGPEGDRNPPGHLSQSRSRQGVSPYRAVTINKPAFAAGGGEKTPA